MLSQVIRTGSALESGLIEFVCEAHAPDEDGPTVTPLRVGWGYCPGAEGDGHRWRQIEPTKRERVERDVLRRLKPTT
jgi:hypothetical protein